MQNAPVNRYFAEQESGSDPELISRGSPAGLLLVGLIFFASSVVILVRVYWIQSRLSERYLSQLEATTTEYEQIPARDGRILADGRVLAVDVEQYDVQVQYRWLQHPADPGWIRQQVRQRLTVAERRDPDLVASVELEIEQQQNQLWQRLSERTGVAPTELHVRRQRIQDRVERIAASVNRRHAGNQSAGERSSSGTDADESFFGLMKVATAIRRALTTTPARTAEATIIVREQETWHTLVSGLPLDPAAVISEHPEHFPGTRILSTTRRSYPERTLAAHLIGARTMIQQHEDADHVDDRVQRTDSLTLRRGRFGVERSYDDQLRGTPGLRKTVRNRRQQIVSSEIIRRPQSGRDISLTIKLPLQNLCERLLQEALADVPGELLMPATAPVNDDPENATHENPVDQISGNSRPVPVGGSVVVLDVSDGSILAAASAPGFDLTLFTDGSVAAWESVNADHRRPFISRFSSMALPPGSTFKTVTAIAGMDAGTLVPGEMFQCQGFLRNPEEHRCLIYRQFGRGHRSVTLKRAIAESCNVYFFDAAQQMGIIPLCDWTERFGFGAPTGVDLPFEKGGTVLRLPAGTATGSVDMHGSSERLDGAAHLIETLRRRYQRDALGLAIGQSRLSVTPLQMARLMAAIANDGWLVTPHVATEEGVSHRTLESAEPDLRFPKVRINGLGGDMLQSVQQGLIAAVQEPYGTGYRTVRLDHVRMAGKTGTAEASPGRPDHAWFAGFAPAENPQFAFSVVLEHGGSGSHAAGPIAREIVRRLFPDDSSTRRSVDSDSHLSAR